MIRFYICLIVFVLPSLYCGLFYRDLWPFSRYALFNQINKAQEKTRYQLTFVSTDGEAFILKGPILWPLNAHFRVAFQMEAIVHMADAENRFLSLLQYYADRIREFGLPDCYGCQGKLQVRAIKFNYTQQEGRTLLQEREKLVLAEVVVPK